MGSVTLRELGYCGVDTDDETAATFCSWWFGEGPDDKVALFSLPSGLTTFATCNRLASSFRSGAVSVAALVYPLEERHGRQDVYVSAAYAKERLGAGKRGGTDNVAAAPGFWADLDVGTGRFHDYGAVYTALMEMRAEGIEPQGVVLTGSGGAHCYWRTPERLNVDDIEEMGQRVQLWLQARFGVKVDSCWNADRVLRLPGTIRWPKETDAAGTGPRLVETLWLRDGVVDLERVRAVTEGAWAQEQEAKRAIRAERRHRDRDAVAALSGFELADGLVLGEGFGGMHLLYTALEAFRVEIPWESVLEPHGWTKYGYPDAKCRQMWTRPHGPSEKVNPRSLITGYVDEPNVASLKSENEPILGRLHRAGVPLSKPVVAAELDYGGSTRDLILDFLRDKMGVGNGRWRDDVTADPLDLRWVKSSAVDRLSELPAQPRARAAFLRQVDRLREARGRGVDVRVRRAIEHAVAAAYRHELPLRWALDLLGQESGWDQEALEAEAWARISQRRRQVGLA